MISRLKQNKHGFKGIKLQRGQIIKFGRYVFKINEMSTASKFEDIRENTEMDIEFQEPSTARDRIDQFRTIDSNGKQGKI